MRRFCQSLKAICLWLWLFLFYNNAVYDKRIVEKREFMWYTPIIYVYFVEYIKVSQRGGA